MRFSVITPSFRNSDWLKLCVASVADQQVGLEHIVQDGGSDDGTLTWLQKDPRVKAFVEPDHGMYDAVNHGLRRAQGEILSYLNCDEQYLPGALLAVESFFEINPAVEVLFCDFVVVNENGDYLFHRKVQKPQLYHTWVGHLSAFTCAIFFRRSVIDRYGIFFDPKFRIAGDAEWVVRLLQKKIHMGVLRGFTSTFTLRGANLGQSPEARREAVRLADSAPPWARHLKPLLIMEHRLRRLFGGIYFQKPFSYSIFSRENAVRRITHDVAHPTFKWRV